MPQEHDVNQRDQFPEEPFTQVEEQRGEAVHKRDRDRQRDQQHHARLAVANLWESHLNERHAAIDENDHGEQRRHPLTAHEFRHFEPEPHLEHGRVKQNRNAQQQRDPEPFAEHVFMSAMICMARMFILCRSRIVHFVSQVGGMRRLHIWLRMRIVFHLFMMIVFMRFVGVVHYASYKTTRGYLSLFYRVISPSAG